ncbi:MAG: hypothetical protein QM779_08290 [Propionicimonas sp.]|uniref:hypothetical protein n=1 Tax=Propionicimonas sp. TaxID=1955623 RepID=UPI003D09D4CE
MSGPLSSVLAEVAAGTPTVVEMARRTGQPETVVRAAIDHLVRTGRIESVAVPIGCPPSGCGGCAAASGGCGQAPGQRSLVTLSLSRRVA